MGDLSTPDAVRELEEDHDLLTYNEAGARLAEEVQRLDREADDLDAAGRSEQAAAVRGRASALREAATRNGRLAKNDVNARGFLEYRPAPPRG